MDENRLDEITNMLGLEELGVRVVAKDSSSMKKGAVGFYSVLRQEIWILEEAIPYWFATLAILLHEKRHHTRRPLFVSALGIACAVAAFSWTYGVFFSTVFEEVLIYLLPILCMIAMKGLHHWYEWDAKRYEKRCLGFCSILVALEYVLISESAKFEEEILLHNLRALEDELRARAPGLIE